MNRPPKVLLVDDEPPTRRLTRLLLEKSGMEVTEAEDGLEGLRRSWIDRPDVIVLDLILPGISGIELTRRYRRRGGRAGILAVTGATGERVLSAALAAGVDFILFKPIAWEELSRLVRALSGGLSLRCREMLMEMGVPESWVGLAQAARCAGLIGESGWQPPQLKAVYIQVSGEIGSCPSCVEKNIRKIEAQVRQTASPLYREIFGQAGRLANGPFLRRLAEAARKREWGGQEEENFL